jgi:DNA-binding transcriptional LysR family regulator
MDTEKCRVLLHVIARGSLSGAAEDLGYTPSGVSRMVSSLEAELGFPLLVRSKSGVVPTAECEELRPVMTQLASLGRTFDETAASLRGLSSGSLRVGSAYHQLYGFLARIIADFSRRYPGIRVDLVQAPSSRLAGMLADRTADFCIMSRRAGLERWVTLQTDEMVAVLPSDHPLAGSDAYPVERFASDAFIEIFPGEESDNSLLLKRCGVHLKPRFSVLDTDAAVALVEAGLGVTILNEIYVRSSSAEVAAVPVSPRTEVEIGIGMPDAALASPALAAFESFALPRLQELVRQ